MVYGQSAEYINSAPEIAFPQVVVNFVANLTDLLESL